jgi:protein-disulfide isomerase
VTITRREFCAGTATLALATAFVAGVAPLARLVTPALAQTPSAAELAAPSPLGEMSLGKADAPVTVIEYASMTCGHCADFTVKTFPELKKRYIDTGKVRFIFREFPLDPLAAAGFMLARCSAKDAGAQASDKYFALVDALFAEQKKWVVAKPIPPLMEFAKQAGFTEQSFEACLTNQELLEGIEKVRSQAAEKFGVNSTPTFFINGKISRGALSIDDMAKQIDAYLKS